MAHLANAEQVAVAWLRQFNDVGDINTLVSDFATSLPAIDRWAKPTFVQVQLISSTTVPNFPEYLPILRIDVFGPVGKWGEVFTVAETIRDLTYYQRGMGELTIREGFYPVRIEDVSIITDPRPIRDDPAALARVTMEVQLTYVMSSEYEGSI